MRKIIDLTMQMDENSPVYPGDPKPEIRQFADILKQGWNEKWLAFGSHFGTHIDAPFHMIEKGKKLDEYPIGDFFGRACVVDARKTNAKNEITADIAKAGKPDFIFFCTGNPKNAQSTEYFTQSPAISKELAEEIIAKKPKAIGIDSWSPDHEPFEIHKMLFSKGILIIENLVNLETLIGKDFECIIAPLKLKDADAAPCRVLAIIRKD